MDESVDVLIVNYKTPDLTAEAVRSVLAEPELHQAIVVDNASGDESVTKLRHAFRGNSKVRIIDSERNGGFGYGNNLAAQASTATFLFLLNSDAYIRPGALGLMIDKLRDPKIGVVAPAVFLTDGKTPQPGGFGRFPTPWRILSRQSTKPVPMPEAEWATGAALMVRREDFLKLGGFDVSIFMYFEDVELCHRFAEHGLSLAFEPLAQVIHHVGLSRKSTWEMKKSYYEALHHYLRLTHCSWLGRVAVRASLWPYIALNALKGEYRRAPQPKEHHG